MEDDWLAHDDRHRRIVRFGGLLYLLIRQSDGDGIDPETFVALGVIYLAFLLLVGYYVPAGYVE